MRVKMKYWQLKSKQEQEEYNKVVISILETTTNLKHILAGVFFILGDNYVQPCEYKKSW